MIESIGYTGNPFNSCKSWPSIVMGSDIVVEFNFNFIVLLIILKSSLYINLPTSSNFVELVISFIITSSLKEDISILLFLSI
jgi:hypothetical protein